MACAETAGCLFDKKQHVQAAVLALAVPNLHTAYLLPVLFGVVDPWIFKLMQYILEHINCRQPVCGSRFMLLKAATVFPSLQVLHSWFHATGGAQ